MRVLVLVDGEHYPSVVRDAIVEIREAGDDVLAAIFCGGGEKLGSEDLAEVYGVPLVRGETPDAAVATALDTYTCDAVIDLTGHPVLTADDRFRLAGRILHRGISYAGSDFELRPVPFADVLTKPSLRVIATGKRTGKTAVAGALARHAVERGFHPVVIAMGRGGPSEPEILEVSDDVSPRTLLELANRGRHAASDYIEDAVTSRVPTIGCRRVGGGFAGAPYTSNVVEGARIAEARDEDLVILEGSGAAIPPVHARTGVICVPATAPADVVTRYLNPYRLLLVDLAVVTMAEDTGRADASERAIRSVVPDIDVVRVVFRPSPLQPIEGKRVFFCSTAPPQVAEILEQHLQNAHGCEVVASSPALADRKRLASQLSEASYDVLVTELKAGAVDVAVRHALDAGREVVFCDNAMVGDGVTDAMDAVLDRARIG